MSIGPAWPQPAKSLRSSRLSRTKKRPTSEKLICDYIRKQGIDGLKGVSEATKAIDELADIDELTIKKSPQAFAPISKLMAGLLATKPPALVGGDVPF